MHVSALFRTNSGVEIVQLPTNLFEILSESMLYSQMCIWYHKYHAVDFLWETAHEWVMFTVRTLAYNNTDVMSYFLRQGKKCELEMSEVK